MPNIHEGILDAKGKKVAIIASRFNDFLTHRLVDGAIDCLVRHGAKDGDLDVFWVPGSFEIPQMAMQVGKTKRFDGILCLGTMIRGETPHFDVLSASVSRAIQEIASRTELPVSFGLITADTVEQAMNRTGAKQGNKGWDGALTLIEMMKLWES
ncbi:MAG: 6,7-dimethyl-8-ribityllumazine synthase [Candidatus Latescibacteria bacterium]|nr:6,7-dimethyl-8-ribityllumazine synthase [Candidatus Latescibacterota bacterium]NIM21103.1 6,7-dimethyl-8-ribityllumazine synthase [Candidatus Latescibacterota bacterium]NIM65238.1 6,7-dimethyl-8-ribityllumazine synthase [Candidatus Latescibacterota bacterium]NIO01753.1 6,7-dimethyl-8-ribityllumazine synthase [Candidatus Latescibacterota bacterium]NIO28270.1 6,7-dimethyl-8-ribityllumazine synthase [Candidatus Latescibacterota bacterium]